MSNPMPWVVSSTVVRCYSLLLVLVDSIRFCSTVFLIYYSFMTLNTECNASIVPPCESDQISCAIAISVQLMELIAEKKGCDLAVFRDIRSELDKMASGGAAGAAGSKRPLSGPGGSDVKKPRLE